MIFFYARGEGHHFKTICTSGGFRPKEVVRRLELKGTRPGVYVFRCGAVYDGYLPKKMRWRREGRRWGRTRYKQLMNLRARLRYRYVAIREFLHPTNVKEPWDQSGW